MGMFDWVECRYPLPGTVADFIAKGEKQSFQTKDLDCCLDHIIIDTDGQLFVRNYDYDTKSELKKREYTGSIHFYTSNLASAGPGYYTRSGEDFETVEYEAKFSNGNLVDIAQTKYERKPALPSRSFREEYPQPTPEEIKARESRLEESLVGKKIYVLYGGEDIGYYADVIAEDDTQLCLRTDKGLKLIRRAERDHLFWDSEQEALNHKNNRRSAWDQRKKEYDDYAEAWKEKHSQ